MMLLLYHTKMMMHLHLSDLSDDNLSLVGNNSYDENDTPTMTGVMKMKSVVICVLMEPLVELTKEIAP